MRITYIKLTGYIGIYNGLGLNEIEIDMSNAPHKITVISGINGCGKSTLLKAMSILPDSSSDFIPDVPAEKKLRIEDTPNVYDICITSAAGKNGVRGMSKASIIKNGVELNPNGNIGSYKEIVFSEFELDSNFITLCRLSSDDRGLADKSPTERKKFMSFIVDSLDTYNAIYKNLNKRSSVFKSYINNLHNKIQNIGDEDVLRAQIQGLKNDAAILNKNLNDLNASIAAASATMVTLDPDGKLEDEYNRAVIYLENQKDSLKRLRDTFDRITRGNPLNIDLNNLDDELDKTNKEIQSMERENDADQIRLNSLIEKAESARKEIDSTKFKVDNLRNEVNPELRESINKAKERIATATTLLSSVGIEDPEEITKDELQLIYDTIQTAVGMVDHLYDDTTDSKMQMIIDYAEGSIEELNNKLEDSKYQLDTAKRHLDDLEKDRDSMSALDKRPEECTIDDCPYIKYAYKLQQTKYRTDNIEKLIEKANRQCDEIVQNIMELNYQIIEMTDIDKRSRYLSRIKELINSNANILCKTNIGRKFVEEFDNNIRRCYNFNAYRDLTELQDCISVMTYYRRDTRMLSELQDELNKQSNSEALLEELEPRLDSLIISEKEYTRSASELKERMESNTNTLERLKSRSKTIESYIEYRDKIMEANESCIDAERNVNDILSKSKDYVDLVERQKEWGNQIVDITNKLTPIQDQISKEETQLSMLDSYKEEYDMYSQKYNVVETLKKYSSPRTGIQTVFMSMYMSKTLELANNVLSMIFGGQYRLLDYVINDNEFRMPFVGSGMVVDDISSGSTSQVCMMGMVMNLVLKYQASPKYNIASLDEIDGGLDTRNRTEFISVLYKLIDILDIDQLFIISHSLELELSNVNIIKLRSYDDFEDSRSSEGGFVLYDFNEMKH